ncbi:MAG TPA: polysaccharide deacetylase family protein [Pseudonocardiaceae bacterium]|nr:polysaccharide deacetylase family protein [Pseudonocardiaceae bacterium]
MNSGANRARAFRMVALTAALATVGALLTMSAPTAVAADQAPAQASVFTTGYTGGRTVTLSFDADWWSPGEVDYVLSVLRSNGITAAFGLTGRYAERYPDQTRAIVAAGHKLVNHSYDHPYFTDLTQAQRWAQLDAAEAAYNRLGLTSAGWFRAPYRDGYLDAGVNRDIALRGYYISFDWTFDTTGYLGASQSVILDRVRRYTVPGAIVIMHIGEGSTDPQNLTAIIATLRGLGYGFTTPYLTVTKGLIGAKYAALGAQRSPLGSARTAELVATTSGTAVQWFQGGRVYWRQNVGAFEVHGAILERYVALGTVNSLLGFPITDETTTPDQVGRFNHFQGGSIYWSPASSSHEVHGAIRDKWAALGWERGVLGYPVTDELVIGAGRVSRFQGGNVYWSAATLAHEVHGAILNRYVSLGEASGRLGFPVTDVLATTSGLYSNFQNGRITWNSTTGVVTVAYSVRR